MVLSNVVLSVNTSVQLLTPVDADRTVTIRTTPGGSGGDVYLGLDNAVTSSTGYQMASTSTSTVFSFRLESDEELWVICPTAASNGVRVSTLATSA